MGKCNILRDPSSPTCDDCERYSLPLFCPPGFVESWMRIGWALLMTIVVMASTTAEQGPQLLRLMPWPESVKSASGSGRLIIGNSFSVSVSAGANPHLRRAVAIFLDDLRRHTGSLPLDFAYAELEKGQLQISVDRA